jgi:uncharacterized protein (TIGR03437 family)
MVNRALLGRVLVMLVAARAATVALAAVQGTLDLVDGAKCRVAGWAKDPTSPSPLVVRIYRDGAVDVAHLVSSTTAGLLRSDLPYPDQNHGFDFALPPDPALADGKPHKLFAYGIDVHGRAELLNASGNAIRCGVLNAVVTDYGARGDGITDDSDAIQRAIDDTFPTGTVLIPAGTYMLGKAHGVGIVYSTEQRTRYGIAGESYALELRGSLTLRGEGRRSILKLKPLRLGILFIRDSVDVLVEKLVFDGNGAQRYLRDPTTGFSYDWPYGNIVSSLIGGGSSIRGATIRDCEIRNGLEDAAAALPGPKFTVEGCYIHDNGAYAVDGSNHGGGAGISMNGGPDNRALHNVIVRNTHGIAIGFGPRNHVVENNTFINNCNGLTIGSHDTTSNDTGQPGWGFSIADNLIERNGVCGGAGFSVKGKESGTLVDNVIINNQGLAGVVLSPQRGTGNLSRDWIVTGNLIANTAPDHVQKAGIYVDASSQRIKIRGNTVVDNGRGVADQIKIQSPTSANEDWSRANTVSFSAQGYSLPRPKVTAVLNAASLRAGPVAPGEMVVIQGAGMGPLGPVAAQVTFYGRTQKRVASVRVLFDGVPAPLRSVSATAIEAAVPYYTYWKDTTKLEVEYQGIRSAPIELSIVQSNPTVFPLGLLNEGGTKNSEANPAPRGSLLTFYATGEGQTNPVGIDGLVSGSTALRAPRGAVAVTVGGIPAEVIEATAAPHELAGKLRVTIRIPVGAPRGVLLPIVLSVAGYRSPTAVGIFVS